MTTVTRQASQGDAPTPRAFNVDLGLDPTPQRTERPMSRAEREAWKLQGVGLNDCEAEIVECSLVSCEPALHGELFRLGIRGSAITGAGFWDALHVESVVFLPDGLFVFSRHLRDQSRAVRAIIFACRDEMGEVRDLAAWGPDTNQVGLWQGYVAMLGQDQILAPRLNPLKVHANVRDWLAADRNGIVILDWPRAADRLDGMTLAVSAIEFGQRVRERLTREPPPVVVERKAEAAA